MIIVTGGAGFIGSNLVRGLNDRGYSDILIVDNLENSAKQRNLNRLEFADFIDKRDFIKNLPSLQNSKIDAVFHQGACSSTTEQNGRYMMENNYEYSKTLLHFCLDKKIRFLYASSASVYGNGTCGFREELACEYPLNVYAFSKYLFDQYIRKLGKLNSQVVGLRYFNVYGPQENHKGKMASVANHFHQEITSEMKVKLFEGSEKFLRDFVYVKDVVKVNLFFFEHPAKSGIFNCGTGKAESFLKIAETMQKLYDREVRIDFTPFPDHLKGKYQAFTQADLSQLRQAGYNEDFTSLEGGVTEYTRIMQKLEGYL